MSFKNVVKLFEVRTLVASVFPVLLGTVYSWYLYDQVNYIYLLLLLVAVPLMQGTTNMLNDYFDYLSGADGSEKSDEKLLVSGEIRLDQVRCLIIVFQVIALLIGVVIGHGTSYFIVLVGVIGSLISVLYATGPIPISTTPFGELVSGLTMGVGITTTVIYIHSGHVNAGTVLMAIPSAVYIGTILLSNNISDMKEDREVGRKTLPIVIGLQRAEHLWIGAVYGLFIFVAILGVLGIYPIGALIAIMLVAPYGIEKKFLSYDKNRSTKGWTMGMIGKIGMKYHIALLVGLIMSRLMS